MFINFIDEYKSVKIVSITTLERREFITLPKSTVCIKLSLYKRFNLNIKKDFKNYFKNMNGSKNKFLTRANPWPDFIVNVAYSYLIYLTDNEASKATDLTGKRSEPFQKVRGSMVLEIVVGRHRIKPFLWE